MTFYEIFFDGRWTIWNYVYWLIRWIFILGGNWCLVSILRDDSVWDESDRNSRKTRRLLKNFAFFFTITNVSIFFFDTSGLMSWFPCEGMGDATTGETYGFWAINKIYFVRLGTMHLLMTFACVILPWIASNKIADLAYANDPFYKTWREQGGDPYLESLGR